MRIDSSSVAWQSQHSASSAQSTQMQISAWRGGQQVTVNTALAEAVRVSINAQALQAAQADQATPPPITLADASTVDDAVPSAADAAENSPKIRLIRAVVEMLSGRPVNTISASDLTGDQPHRPHSAAHSSPAQGARTVATPLRLGAGMSVSMVSTYTEQESTSVQGSATVHTADGKTLSIDVSVAMARSYSEQSTVTIQVGNQPQAKDPLVLNFDGKAAQLKSETFSFDLNGDGKAENVAMLGGNSGYLAIDTNGNGKIDSGKELFGPATGQGFQELAAYDQDGNGWIDEGDAVFKKLQIWKPAGNDLQSAASMGVGAISLSNTASPFELRNNANQSLGTVRSTGMYLMENGSAGTVQQIDLVV